MILADMAALPPLKSVCGRKFAIGCALDGDYLPQITDREVQLMREQFDVVTVERCLKSMRSQPREGEFRFDLADALLDFSEKNGLKVIGHCLVWHQACAEWFFDRPESTLDRLRTHIHTLVGRYRGRIVGWDVVNEAIADKGEYLRPTKWLETLGEDFIARAFEFAHEADPDVELYYNDYNIELPDKRQRTLRLLRDLQSRGVRLDAVGIQGHWILDQAPFDEIERAIVEYHALGLKVMITELDLDVIDRPDCGADPSLHAEYTLEQDIYRDGCPDEVLARQAEQYGRLFEIFNRHHDNISRVSFWGLNDGDSWLNRWPGKRTNHPLLFDRQCKPKPAFEAVVRAMK